MRIVVDDGATDQAVEIALEAFRPAGLGPGQDQFVMAAALGFFDDGGADQARRRFTGIAAGEARHKAADTGLDRAGIGQRQRTAAAIGDTDDVVVDALDVANLERHAEIAADIEEGVRTAANAVARHDPVT